MATKTLSVVITGDANGAQKAFQQTAKGSDDLATKIESAGKKMATVGKNLSIGITAPVVAFAAMGFKELEESGKVAAQTEAAIRSTGGAANVSAKQVDNLAQSLLAKSGIDDETIKSGENLLLTFKNIRNESGKGNDIFNQATKATLDLSVALGKDMSSSAIMVGKALNDPVAGLTALGRAGVQFTAAQKATIKSLVESGDVMGAQKLILKELTSQVGGSAAAYGETMAGQVSKAKEELKNAAAAMVTVAAPAIKFLGDRAMDLAGFLSDLPGPAKTAVGAVAAFAAAIGPVLFIGGKLMQLAKGIATAWGALGDAFVAAERAAVNAGISLAAVAGPVAVFVGVTAGVAAAIAAVGFAIDGVFGIDSTGRGSFGQVLDALDKGKKQGATWADGIIAGAKASANPIAELEARLASLRASRDAEAASAREGGMTQEQAANAYGRYSTAIDQTKKALAESKTEQIAAKAALDQQKAALDQAASGQQNLAAATDTGRQAIQNFNNTILGAAGGPIAYAQAVQNQATAQQAYNDAVAQFGPNSAEAAAAQLNLQAAQLGVSSAAAQEDAAQAALVQSLASGNTTYEQQKALLDQQLQQHPENAAGIDLEKQALDRAKAAADALPGSKTVTVTADTSQFWNAIQGVNSEVQSGANRVVTVFVDTVHREFGGP